MTEAARALLRALRERSGGRRRVPIDSVWAAFGAALPGYLGGAEARSRLAALLDELGKAGELALPRSRQRWDYAVAPPLPQWISLPAPPLATQPTPDFRKLAWPPALAFVPTLRQAPYLHELLCIRDFLAAGGASRPMVPARERSLELFGDEKRLDALLGTALFAPGRLRLEDIRCFSVPPPLSWEPGPAGACARILVIENAHTFASFRRWNGRAGAYRAIAYGQGGEFRATAQDVPRLVEELALEVVEYFGDLDAAGIDIAAFAATLLAERGVTLAPATRWYELLLNRAEQVRLPGSPCEPPPSLRWLGAELAGRARAVLVAGWRAPQELVGWEQLCAD